MFRIGHERKTKKTRKLLVHPRRLPLLPADFPVECFLNRAEERWVVHFNQSQTKLLFRQRSVSTLIFNPVPHIIILLHPTLPPPPLPSSNVVSRLSFFFGVLRYLHEKGEIASLKGVGGGGGWGEFLLFNAIWRSETVLRRKQTVSTSNFLFACRFKCDKTLVHTATISIVESEKC